MDKCIKLGIALERQNQFNRSIKTAMIAVIFCMAVHKAEIKRLNKEIEELKSAKGE